MSESGGAPRVAWNVDAHHDAAKNARPSELQLQQLLLSHAINIDHVSARYRLAARTANSTVLAQNCVLRLGSDVARYRRVGTKAQPQQRRVDRLPFRERLLTGVGQRRAMYLVHLLRSQQLRDDFVDRVRLETARRLLEDTMDTRMYSSLHNSSASAPSLRASEPAALMAPPVGVDDPGNVKVVVRCRAFLKRGE